VSQELLYFDRNENPYGPAPACFDVLRNATIEHMSCYSRDFTRGVQSPLSERLASDFDIPESSILLGYGGEDILKQTVHCYLATDERIMIPSHSWWYYKSISDEVGGVKVEYPIVEGSAAFAYDIDSMIALYRAHSPRLVLISSPNNPTGNSMRREDLLHLLGHLTDTVVVLDEAYCLHSDLEASFLRDLYHDFHNLLVVRTFSKYFALAGLRIGYAVMGKRLTRLSQFSARYLGYHRLSERVALAALDSPDHYREIADAMNADKLLFRERLHRHDGFTVYDSDANFLLVKIPGEIRDALKIALTARGLIVKFMNEEVLNSHIRITIGTREQNRLLLDAIDVFMSQTMNA
jgi:histidinol-phosphate aminotransferase